MFISSATGALPTDARSTNSHRHQRGSPTALGEYFSRAISSPTPCRRVLALDRPRGHRTVEHHRYFQQTATRAAHERDGRWKRLDSAPLLATSNQPDHWCAVVPSHDRIEHVHTRKANQFRPVATANGEDPQRLRRIETTQRLNQLTDCRRHPDLLTISPRRRGEPRGFSEAIPAKAVRPRYRRPTRRALPGMRFLVGEKARRSLLAPKFRNGRQPSDHDQRRVGLRRTKRAIDKVSPGAPMTDRIH